MILSYTLLSEIVQIKKIIYENHELLDKKGVIKIGSPSSNFFVNKHKKNEKYRLIENLLFEVD